MNEHEILQASGTIAIELGRRGPLRVDTVEKGFWGGCLSNIDSRSSAPAQSRFKNPFVRIRLFQILIPQLHFGDFFNTIGQNRPFGDVGPMSALSLFADPSRTSREVREVS